MRYRGFMITSCYDNGIGRDNGNTNEGETCGGYYCQVYPADDDQYAYELDNFCLAAGYGIPDNSDESLERGIINYINEMYDSLKAALEGIKSRRKSELIGRLVCWIGENETGADLYDTLSNTIGMTDDEIREIGFTSLVPFFDPESYAQTIAEYLIGVGTENTGSGNWMIPFEEINQRYAVNLPADNVLLRNISIHLYGRSDSVADFCITDEGVELDFYYGQCPKYCRDVQEEETDADIQLKM